MTLHSPTLIVNRLLIVKAGRAVFDEPFHYGLNVIRGQNSSGKTTIVKALVYGLGGGVPNLTDELQLCDFVIVDVQINGEFVTLKRIISDSNREGMEIFWGRYSESVDAGISSWSQYSYSRSGSKESFTQRIFGAMGMPEVKGYQSAIVTMHQILRLMYGDQSTPSSEIFSSDTFDSQDVRQAVGDLLCGIYNDELYNLKKRRDIDSKMLIGAASELRGLFSILNKSEGEMNFLNFDQEIMDTQNRIQTLRGNLTSLVAGDLEVDGKEVSQERKKEIVSYEKLISKLRSELLVGSEELDGILFEVADSEMFISTLNHKANCLDDAIRMKTVFESISFEFCPSCHSSLAGLPREPDQCKLCGFQAEIGENRNHHKMRNDIVNQINESKNLLVDRISRKEELELKVPYLKKKLTALESKYRSATQGVRTSRESMVEKLSTEIGSLERTNQYYIDQSKIFDEVRSLMEKRNVLQSSINAADDIIRGIVDNLEVERLSISRDISNEIIAILQQDLNRQDAFQNAESVTISFEKNRFSVDGVSVFSESSTVFAKNAMLLGIMSASMKNESMRFPRFLILDGIENGGMERDRSYNFQEIMMNLSDSFEIDHQIIITTAEIAPDIESSPATVGELYTVSNKSLKFANKQMGTDHV